MLAKQIVLIKSSGVLVLDFRVQDWPILCMHKFTMFLYFVNFELMEHRE